MDNGAFAFITHPQKRIWTMEQLYPSSHIHNLTGLSILKDTVDFHRLDEEIQAFISIQDGIRMRFSEDNGILSSYIEPYSGDALESYDFSTTTNPCEQYEDWLTFQNEMQFELINSCLFYFALIKIDNNQQGFYFRIHHIISDGWSITTMIDTIWDHYQSISNKPYNVSGSYYKWAIKEGAYLASPRAQKDREFWNNKFDNFPLITQPANKNLEGSRKTVLLPLNLSENIKKFANENGFSLNTFFLSSMFIYTYLLTNDKDISIGTPVMNRASVADKSVFGMFTSTMPVRTLVQQDQDAATFLQTVRSELLRCYHHQKYPYDLLVKDLGLVEKGGESLFQICVNYYNGKFKNEASFPLELIDYHNGQQVYSLQLVIKDWRSDGLLELSVDYKLCDYTSEDIDLFYNRYFYLIEQIINNPTVVINDLKLLPPSEIQFIEEWNQTKLERNYDCTIIDLFEQRAKEFPDSIALQHDEYCMSYEMLNYKANGLAQMLISKGVRPNSLIGVHMTHSVETVIAILGILKIGAAYLPLEPKNPYGRIKYILDNAGARFVLCNNPASINDFQNTDAEWISITAENIKIKKENINIKIASNDLAYVIYTSGSTGVPKGVMIEHSGLFNYIRWASEIYVKNVWETFALYTSLAFDLTVTTLFTPLVNGNKLLIYPEDDEEFVLHKILRDKKTHILKLTPAHLSLLMDEDYSDSGVLRFIVGGEDLKTKLCRQVVDSFGGFVEIYNEYGPTETVVGCMTYLYSPEYSTNDSVPIGKPIDNLRIHLLDELRRQVPIGICGEIYVTGFGDGRGYWRNQALTNATFVEIPYNSSELAYKTGDLGKLLPNGDMIYLGRTDSQIKIKGYRIEIGEIENHLYKIPQIREAVVVDRPDENGEIKLCAFFVADERLPEMQIWNLLMQDLPAYMIPKYFIQLQHFTLSSNGKIDRIILRDYPLPLRGVTGEAQNERQRYLAHIYGMILQVQDISMQDNFYQLGGDSIKAIQIASKFRKQGMRITVRQIMEYPTIGMIDELIMAFPVQSGHYEAKGEIQHTPITAWFIKQHFPNPHHWHQSLLLSLKHRVSVQQLEKILRKIVRQHDSLRINVNQDENSLFYNLERIDAAPPIHVCELSACTAEETEYTIKKWGDKIKSSMRIDKDWLFQAVLFNTPVGEEQKLLLTAHHLLVDGISWRILLEDMAKLIELNSDPIDMEDLGPKTDSYQKWASYLQKYSEQIRDEKENVRENPPSLWHCLLESPSGSSAPQGRSSISLNLETWSSKDLHSAAKTYGVQLFDFIIYAVANAAGLLTNCSEIVLELEGHGREEISDNIDILRTIGWFTTMYPVNIQLFSKLPLKEKVQDLRKQLRGHAKKGFDYHLKADYEKPSSLVRVNFMGEFSDGGWSDYFTISSMEHGEEAGSTNQLSCPIEIVFTIINGILQITINYQSPLYNENTMQMLRTEIINTIEEMIITAQSSNLNSFDTVDLSQQDFYTLFG